MASARPLPRFKFLALYYIASPYQAKNKTHISVFSYTSFLDFLTHWEDGWLV